MTDFGSVPGANQPDLDWLIQQLANEVPTVTHALVVSLDGLQLAHTGAVDRDLGDQLAALTAGILSIGGQYGQWLQLGQPENLTIRFPHGHVAFMRIADTAGLCVAARAGTDMRTLAFAMTKFVQAVGHALTPEMRTRLHERTVARTTS
jgi:predicted regulator of Ras-like GTPase activity (Roadblock/LC7/MglB family)